MDKPNDGGSAFPSHGSMGEVAYEGMSLRDYLAGQALSRIATSIDPRRTDGPLEIQWSAEEIDRFYQYQVKQAYILADAMLAERNKNV